MEIRTLQPVLLLLFTLLTFTSATTFTVSHPYRTLYIDSDFPVGVAFQISDSVEEPTIILESDSLFDYNATGDQIDIIAVQDVITESENSSGNLLKPSLEILSLLICSFGVLYNKNWLLILVICFALSVHSQNNQVSVTIMVPPNWAFDTISINANGGGIVNSTDELSSISIISFDLNFCGGSSDILLDTFSVRDSLKLCADSVSVSNLMIVQNPVELVFEASEDVIVSFFEGYVGRYTIESNDILVTNDFDCNIINEDESSVIGNCGTSSNSMDITSARVRVDLKNVVPTDTPSRTPDASSTKSISITPIIPSDSSSKSPIPVPSQSTSKSNGRSRSTTSSVSVDSSVSEALSPSNSIVHSVGQTRSTSQSIAVSKSGSISESSSNSVIQRISVSSTRSVSSTTETTITPSISTSISVSPSTTGSITVSISESRSSTVSRTRSESRTQSVSHTSSTTATNSPTPTRTPVTMGTDPSNPIILTPHAEIGQPTYQSVIVGADTTFYRFVPTGNLVVFYDTCKSNVSVSVTTEEMGNTFTTTNGCSFASALLQHVVQDGQTYDFSVFPSGFGEVSFEFGAYDIIRGSSCSDVIPFNIDIGDTVSQFNYLSKSLQGEQLFFTVEIDTDTIQTPNFEVSMCKSNLTSARVEIYQTCGGVFTNQNITSGCAAPEDNPGVFLPSSIVTSGNYTFVITNLGNEDGVAYASFRGCFAANTMVIVKDRGIIPMIELKTGDWVLGANNEWVQIVSWMHRDTTATLDFTVVYFESGNATLSPDHFIFIENENGDVIDIRADKVQPGNILIGKDGEKLIVERIDTITYDTGIYAPLTSSGEIIIDGVLASCFTEVDLPKPFMKNSHFLGNAATFITRNWPSYFISDYTPDSKEYGLTSKIFLSILPLIDSVSNLIF